MSGTRVRALICDFGGVLTTPMWLSFLAVQDETGVSPEQLAVAMDAASQETGSHPLFELEKGRMSERDFLTLLGHHLEPQLGHRPDLHRFREIYFEALNPNEPMIELVGEARDAGLRRCLLTNNVREWEPLWRSMIPIDELFEFVVDSAFVGMRKPEHEIYELSVQGFGDGVTAADCLFVDDSAGNCEAAERCGMRVVQFVGDESVAAVRTALGLPG
jgi:putative hydrolase of the HAD superfamily